MAGENETGGADSAPPAFVGLSTELFRLVSEWPDMNSKTQFFFRIKSSKKIYL